MKSREAVDVKIFFRKFLLFLFPFIVVLFFPFFIFWITGEFTSVENRTIVRLADTQQLLYGPAYTDCTINYKLFSIADRHPLVIALGSSRVMQFRSDFFASPKDFFNAGGSINKTQQLDYFLEKISTDYEPKAIILGLDQFWFDDDWDSLIYNESVEKYGTCEKIENIFLAQWLAPYKDFISHKFSLANLQAGGGSIKKIGLNAIVNDNGFRNDGSYNYGKIIKERCEGFTFEGEFDNILKNNKMFGAASTINARALENVESFLKKSKMKGIRVIGFMPPYAQSVYEKLKASEGNYPYVFNLEPVLKKMFEKYDFTLQNFSDITSFGSSDREMIDGIHGSEKTYLRLLIKMSENDSVLKSYTNSSSLHAMLEASSPIEVLNNCSL